MKEGAYEDRYNEARDRIEALITQFPDVFGANLGLPAPPVYALVVAVDDIADGESGTFQIMYPRSQWRYVTLGLFEWSRAVIMHNAEHTGLDEDPDP